MKQREKIKEAKKKLHTSEQEHEEDEDNEYEEEIMNIVNEGHEQGAIMEGEARMITNIFEFGDKDVTVYTSYPHLLRIRTIFEDMKNAIMNNVAFISDRGLTVNDQYAEPRTIANIGGESKFISFRFIADGLVDNNNNCLPAVELIVSNAPQACILTIDSKFVF